MSATRSRWAAIGAAVAVTIGAGVGTQHFVSAGTSSGDRPVLVPITPCRLVDTRGADPIGPRNTPLGPGDVHTVVARGANGKCTIPADAVALSMNVTAIGASAPTFLTIWPAGAAQPGSSSLNPTPGAPPTPNAVTTSLSADGRFSVYNLQGAVDILVDVNGYYVAHDHDDRYYTKPQVDASLAGKANAADVYLRGAVDSALAGKANAADVYTKTQVDDAVVGSLENVYTKTEVDGLLTTVNAFQRIVVVHGESSPSGNGTALIAAINAVASSGPSATAPWTILLEPGRYEAATFPPLPAYTALTGSGRDVSVVHDTNDGPAITGSGMVWVSDLTVSQGGTSSSAHFTSDVELHRVRVVTATSNSAAAGLSITGAGVDARLTDVLVDDGDPTTALGNRWGLSVNDGASADLIDSDIDDVYGALQVGFNSPATVSVRNSRLDAISSSIQAFEGTVAVDNSVLTNQIAAGNSTDDVLTVTVRNSSMTRVFFNGTGTTGARTIVIEGSTLSGGVDGGAGDGATSATVRSTSMVGTVNADFETCTGVTGSSSFFPSFCP